MAGEKIIIVDDEVDVLDLCKHVLETNGYQVRTAHNGRQVIDLALSERFDLLLTDIKMPGMTGLEIAQILKKADPSTICVIMTGYSTMDMVIEALKLGIDEFVMKPFTPQELSMAIVKALEKQQLRKENFRLNSLIPLFELNKTLMGAVEVDKVLSRLLDISHQETKADLASIYTYQVNRLALFTGQVDELPTILLPETGFQLAEFALDQGTQLTLSLHDIVDQHHRQLLEELAVQSLIITPLKSKEANLGVLVLARVDSNFAPSDSDFLAVLASQASIALENAHLFTEIQEAYKELKVLDYMKSEFINIAAHELRTPLAILMGYAAVLEDDLEGTTREYMANIMRNALRLRSIIDDMLSLQYLESGLASLANDPLDLNEVMVEVLQDMSLPIKEKNLSVNLNIQPDFPPMIADRQKFDLIIVNLMNNAIKFTPAGGKVTFKASANGDKATMSITNTGACIPKDKLDRIFDRFVQLESSLTREHGGMGLGLSIVRGMVEFCGGKIRVESEEETGTTFTFTLPLDNTLLKNQGMKLKL